MDLLCSSLSAHERHQAVAFEDTVCVYVCVRVRVRVHVLLIVVLCTCVYSTSIYVILFEDQLFKVLGIQSCIRCTLAWRTAIFVNSTTELGLSQMRVKGLEVVCKRSLQLFREGPVVPEAEELQRRIQAASTEERPRRIKCTVL